MAIILRNGVEADFDGTKLRAAEPAVVTDTKKVYVGFGNQESERVMLEPDVNEALEPINENFDEIVSGKEEDAKWHLGFYLDEEGYLCQE